jgi:putative ABC transport system substrate-binding protein
VIVMTSFLDGQRDLPAAATGISYEVPLITVVTNLRKLVSTRIERVGVIQRQPLSGFVDRQAELAQLEQTHVIRETVSHDPNASEIKRALRRLKEQVDALWILNDDRLLSGKLIAEGWLPGLNERPWVPNIVGAPSLVSPAHSFGTFAVLPDHAALGVQAANLVFDIADNDWTLPARDAELPVSTTTTVDLPQVLERFSLRDGALSQVDRILER